MNISSLLCSEDPPSERRVIAEPVVLAPHLVRQQHQQHTQSSKLNLEALVHAADQERRRLDSHHSSHSPHDSVSYSYPQRDAERERERQWEREKGYLEREKEREQVQREWEREQREREREREQRQFLHQHHQQHQQQPQQQHDQNHQDRFFRQREQRQYHRESILGYPSRPESLSPRSHIPLFDQQPTLRASASPKISNLLSSSPHVSRLPLSNSPPYTATDILPQARPLPISSSHPPPYTISIPSDDETDHDRSSKRRRHSDSIAQQIHHHGFDVDRLNKERELMTSSGLGYGRSHHPSQSIHSDPVKLPISPETVKPSTSSRKPGSSGYSYDPVHDQDTPLPPPLKRPASDTADEKDRERAKNSINFLTGGIQGNPREYHQPSQQAPLPLTFREHRVVSPAGRRSPPGSYVGRALAARHHDHSHLQDPGLNRVKVERRESALPPTPVPPTAPTPVFLRAQSSEGLEKEREKEKDRPFEKKKGRSRTSNEVVVRQDLVHKAPKPSAATLSHPHPHSLAQAAPPSAKSRHEDDAHDWFLEQLDDDAVSKRPRSPSRTPSPPPSSIPVETSGKRHSKSPFVHKRTPSPVQDAVMALEQELEDVIDNRKSQQVSNDMDVDQVVTELVEETLGADEEEGKQMEVDVEDELLSLVDDRPTTAVPLSHGTRHTSQTTNEVKGKQTSMKNSTSRPESPSAASPSFRSPSVRATSPRQTSERDSMPPPAVPTIPKESGKKKKNEDKTASDQPKKKGKPGPKPKPRNPDGTIVGAPPPPPKPRGKPGPKPKPRDRDGNIIRTPVPPVAPGNKSSTTTTPPVPSRSVSASQQARSRSASALPGGSVGPEESSKPEEGAEDSDAAANDDDKLYCVCKTRYDEDKSMIACDSCDEWYHTNCVDMPDHVVELVDQFACPPCVAKNPSLNLKTTYKSRCLFGLLQPDPESPKSCHKPARTYSKYCSDECGMKNISKRVDMFVRRGGNKSQLWETVKNAEKREGLIRCVEESSDGGKPVIKEVKPKKTAKEKEVDRLNGLLDDIAKVREELKRGMEIIAWREQLIELAAERAKAVQECGWDQRLCFADEEWVEHGELVLESYRDDKMETGAEGEDAVWWCTGEEVCRRHAGWQALRTKDVCKEKEKKADALGKLTSKEREIRKHIENIIDIDDDGAPPAAPLKSSNKQHHGNTGKRKVNGDVAANKKGKKRKAPT
ncbi:hypothetical protein L218DRAFT_952430 [Marasmius fiardii PR-910]|nr:hypothetical protein L218DRAFT_952430 [Marasmius fiardii PR-910]